MNSYTLYLRSHNTGDAINGISIYQVAFLLETEIPIEKMSVPIYKFDDLKEYINRQPGIYINKYNGVFLEELTVGAMGYISSMFYDRTLIINTNQFLVSTRVLNG